MKALITILRAAHCRSTHHFFAVDALPLTRTESGKQLAALLLSYHDEYLRGAKDPDTRFRDFQNHVIHVQDGCWGGAPRVAQQWYDRLLKYLRTDRFEYAAHAAGVLSHYFTDPIMPLHTAQCDYEKVVHRPLEWSITKSYQTIFQKWQTDDIEIVFDLSEDDGWLGDAIVQCARFANKKYNQLIDDYNLELGVENPIDGFDKRTHEQLSELFGLAITGWARILDRAGTEMVVQRDEPLPEFPLSLPALLATIKMPVRWWVRRIETKSEQEAVTSLLEEYKSKGKLEQHLPAEVDIVQRVTKVYHDEVKWKEKRERRKLHASKSRIEVQESPEPVLLPFESKQNHYRSNPSQTTPQKSNNRLRFRLAASDPLVDAPSIGSKTAQRFANIGINVVAEFLAASADKVAEQLETYWITADTIRVWQHQSTLMCEVPGLRAIDTQLLTGSGCECGRDLASANADTLHIQIIEYAATSAGKRYLRGGDPPQKFNITQWIEDASEAMEQRSSKKAA